MFTRSARRVNTSLREENGIDNNTNRNADKNMKKHQMKENLSDDFSLPNKKRRDNYVSYPTDDEGFTGENGVDGKVNNKKTSKKVSKILKESNQIDLDSDDNIQKKVLRLTRQTKKNDDGNDYETVLIDKQNKRSKKYKVVDTDVDSVTLKNVEVQTKTETSQVLTNEVEQETGIKKKNKSKKKKGKSSKSSHGSRNNEEKNNRKTDKSERSNASIDSFHSAAGSPLHDKPNPTKSVDNTKTTKSNNKNKDEINKSNTSISDLKSVKKRKSSTKIDTLSPKHKDETPEKSSNVSLGQSTDINVGVTKTESQGSAKRQSKKCKSSMQNNTVNIEDIENETSYIIDQNTPPTKYDNSAIVSNSVIEDSIGNISGDKTLSKKETSQAKTDIKKDSKLDTTFDKIDKESSSKSSIISSDNSNTNLNVTYDKSDLSRISITSDDSKAENIVNTSPVLIESSMDDSNIPGTPKRMSVSKDPPTTTPLKREGTFTKDSPKIVPSRTSLNSQTPTKQNSITPRKSLEKTPIRRVSMGTPGSTPFPISKSSQREKIQLNVTRSIEKQNSRRSLVGNVTRTTRVMFCSPLDNHVPTTEAKRKIVKSSLKGSNKSFVFDDTACRGSPALPLARKRSQTQDETHSAKRSRIADDSTSVLRSRTLSASAKLSTTPSKKPVTPSKASRTKLPNFAALHQKRFEKMESLDECQARKAKRAKQLLTVTGASPMKQSSESNRKSEVKTSGDTKSKPEVQQQKERPPLPTLESMRKGYTRFGFRMNVGVNPFSVPSTNQKNKSFSGVGKPISSQVNASIRKETAKQIIMGQKPSSSKRNEQKRMDNRTVIKGVRTNRRFELQMKMRNLDG